MKFFPSSVFCMCSNAALRLTSTLQMAPKKKIIYARGKSKSVVPSRWVIVNSDNEQDPAYVPLGVTTQTTTPQVTKGDSRKVNPGVVTASQSDVERTLTDSPTGAESSSDGDSAFGIESASASGWTHFYGSNKATVSGSASQGATRSEGHDNQASSDEATSSESSPVPQ